MSVGCLVWLGSDRTQDKVTKKLKPGSRVWNTKWNEICRENWVGGLLPKSLQLALELFPIILKARSYEPEKTDSEFLWEADLLSLAMSRKFVLLLFFSPLFAKSLHFSARGFWFILWAIWSKDHSGPILLPVTWMGKVPLVSKATRYALLCFFTCTFTVPYKQSIVIYGALRIHQLKPSLTLTRYGN